MSCGIRFQAWWIGPPDEKVSDDLWVLSAYLLIEGASVRQLQVLGISYRTASVIAKGVRERLGLRPLVRRQLAPRQVVDHLRTAAERRGLSNSDFRRRVCALFWTYR